MPPLPTPFTALRAVSRRVLSHPQPLLISRYATTHRSLNTSSSTTDTTNNTPSPQKESKFRPARNLGSHKPRAATKSNHPGLQTPNYELTMTCTPCGERSTHSISKHGYHFGSVLVTCPSCRNRHVMSDHLGIFGDRDITIEDLMREQGQIIKKGTLSEDGDVEFWSDGSMTRRAQAWVPPESNASETAARGEDGERVKIRGETFKTPPKDK